MERIKWAFADGSVIARRNVINAGKSPDFNKNCLFISEIGPVAH